MGRKVTKLIGYDADEVRRAHIQGDEKYEYAYPLIEWGWGRDECLAAIDRAGLKSPGKSACFFCPSSKKVEIYELRRVYPDLAGRAVAMEKNAELTQVKGLGRNFAWADLYEAEDRQSSLFGNASFELKQVLMMEPEFQKELANRPVFPESNIEIDCGCYDG